MKIQEINLYRYSIPLKKGIKMKGFLHNSREGCIVELIDEQGIKGYGEAAPFPGLHSESLDKIIQQFLYLKKAIYNIDLKKFNIFSLDLPPCSHALFFGIEWAIIELMSKRRQIAPSRMLNIKASDSIYLNPLLTGTYEEVIETARLLARKNPKSVKLKVGFRPLEDDIYLVKKIDDLFENKVMLRLDANRKWSLNQAVTFGQSVVSANIEYIEEPLENPLQLSEFYQKTGITFGLDESLSENIDEQIENFKGLSALVIKPSVIGPLRKIKSYVDMADKMKLSCVFSSTFESGIGLWAIANLACAFASPNSVHGLDTYQWMENDIIEPGFSSDAFKINIHAENNFSLNTSLLTKVVL